MPAFDDSKKIQHPAFGQISASRVSGQKTLFQVGYPQGHYIALRIKTAELHRDLSREWVFGRKEIIEINLSAVQWAEMISNMNTEGVPCTLVSYHDPVTGEYVHWKQTRLEDDHAGKVATFKGEVKETAQDAAKALNDAEELLRRLTTPGASVKKADVTAVLDAVATARRELSANLPFVVQQAEEAIEKAAGQARANFHAFVDHAMISLGERALGEKFQALADDRMKREMGEEVIASITVKPETQEDQ